MKHQDESVEGEAVDETPVSLEDKTAKEEPVEAVEEKEEATGEVDEVSYILYWLYFHSSHISAHFSSSLSCVT